MDVRQDQALQLFQRYRKQVGFIVRADFDDYTVYTVDRDSDVVGAALADHAFGGHTLVHAIAVDRDARGQGVATALVDQIASDSPHDTLRAKCRTDLTANEFYRQSGWDCERETGDGQMTVWRYDC